jgi:hypothetical protein
MKSATKRCGRALVDLGGRAELLDAPAIHHRDAVGQAERLGLVVGDEDRGDTHRALDGAQLVRASLAQLLVQRGQRLVEQQHARPIDEGARQRHALLHAARELAGALAPGRSSRTSSSASPTRRSISAAGIRRSAQPNATFSPHREMRERGA